VYFLGNLNFDLTMDSLDQFFLQNTPSYALAVFQTQLVFETRGEINPLTSM